MADPVEAPTVLTYTPIINGKAAPEEDSGRLEDLYLCPETAQLFTIVNMRLDIDQRSSRSAKQFFCPCCPKSALSISTESDETIMKCYTCGWDARHTGVTTVSELLQRDGDPFPWISEELRVLTRHLKMQNHSQDHVHLTEDWNASTQTGTARAASMHRLRGQRKSMIKIERRPREEELNKAESATQAAQNFVRVQEEKERLVFSSWLPDESGFNASPTDNINMQPGRPIGDISLLTGEMSFDDLVPFEKRVCSTTWLRRDCAAQRRVPRPRVTIRSPFGKHDVARTVEEVIPPFRVCINGDCNELTLRSVKVCVDNAFAYREMTFSVANADDPSESAEICVRQGEIGEVCITPFTLVQRESNPITTFHQQPPCPRLISLNITVVYAEGEFARQAFYLRVYARHAAHRR